MSFYGTTTRSDDLHGSFQGRPVIVSEVDGAISIRFADERQHRNVYSSGVYSSELDGLLNSVPIVPVDNTRAGRFGRHYRKHQLRYSLLLWTIIIITLVINLVPYYNEKDKNPPICESDRNYAVAVISSMFFGMFGVDRFYLGYTFMGFLKLFTAGGFGCLWVIDIVLITVGALPDHKGCVLVSPF